MNDNTHHLRVSSRRNKKLGSSPFSKGFGGRSRHSDFAKRPIAGTTPSVGESTGVFFLLTGAKNRIDQRCKMLAYLFPGTFALESPNRQSSRKSVG